jgi:hypothetical protein
MCQALNLFPVPHSIKNKYRTTIKKKKEKGKRHFFFKFHISPEVTGLVIKEFFFLC